MLETCAACQSFLPPGAAACPNCDAPCSPPSSVAGTLQRAAGLGMMMVTLMACYAAGEPYADCTSYPNSSYCCLNEPSIECPGYCTDNPYVAECCDTTVQTIGTGSTLVECLGNTNVDAGTCVGGRGAERIFSIVPDYVWAGQAGTLTVSWTGSQNGVGVYLRDPTSRQELACASPGYSGAVSIHLDEAWPVDLYVDSENWIPGGQVLLDVAFALDTHCADPTPLVLGANLGDNAGAPLLPDPGCGLGDAPAGFYSFEPTVPGTATLTLSPSTGLWIYGASGCDTIDPTCLSGTLTGPAAPGAPVLAVVVGNAGPYQIDVAFEPTCGNGTLDPGETCDDGGTTPGDGCDASCQVEAAFHCAAASPLQPGDNAGDTTGGVHVLPTCTGSAAPQRLYTWTAPSNGVLVLSLASMAADLTVAVFPACGGSWAACANSFPAGQAEVLSPVVVAGQTYYLVVDGHADADAGPFTLSATFVPTP